MAARVGVTRVTVWRRLSHWRRIGFLGGYEFIPNPRALGAGMVVYKVEHDGPGAVKVFLDELELVDGIFSATLHLGAKTTVVSVAGSPASQAMHRTLLSRLPGVLSVAPPFRIWLPECSRPLTTADWRMISALRSTNGAPVARIARRIGVSPRSLARRLKSLRDSNVMLTFRIENFRNFPGTVAAIGVQLRSKAESRAIAATIQDRVHGLLEITHLNMPPYAPHDHLAFCLQVGNPSDIQEVEAMISGIKGVTGIETRFPGVERTYRVWFDERVRQALRIAPA